MTVIALVVAAGRGRRLTGDRPKQYRPLDGGTILGQSIRGFVAHPDVATVRVVIHPDDAALYAEATAGLDLLPPVMGGQLRRDSVLNGLEAIAQDWPHARVLVHDAARPFVPPALIDRVIAGLFGHAAAVPALPVTDTLKRGANGLVHETLSREGLYRIQTPQGFDLAALIAAHRRFPDSDVTDDAALMELAGHEVVLVEGAEEVFKVTTTADLERAQEMLAGRNEIRVGMGYDVHRFTAGDHVMLCGLPVPHTQALAGHSDADVGLHAIVDALLGALGEGDIGQHFPPSDPKWKGAPSRRFLEEAAARVSARAGRILHIDVTIICEAPRVGPHRTAMAAHVASILGIAPGRVSIKATTTEKLGFTGRGEGMAAQAVATLELPGKMWEKT